MSAAVILLLALRSVDPVAAAAPEDRESVSRTARASDPVDVGVGGIFAVAGAGSTCFVLLLPLLVGLPVALVVVGDESSPRGAFGAVMVPLLVYLLLSPVIVPLLTTAGTLMATLLTNGPRLGFASLLAPLSAGVLCGVLGLLGIVSGWLVGAWLRPEVNQGTGFAEGAGPGSLAGFAGGAIGGATVGAVLGYFGGVALDGWPADADARLE